MQLSDAIALIQAADLPNGPPARWADLGCGSGLFTYALASLLPTNSEIYAVDLDNTLVRQATGNNVTVHFQRADFTRDSLKLPQLDGILMANSLHYAHNKPALLRHLANHLSPDGLFLIVEYDTTRSNRWVPYPESFVQLSQLFTQLGFSTIQKLGERESIYGQGNLYACLISS